MAVTFFLLGLICGVIVTTIISIFCHCPSPSNDFIRDDFIRDDRGMFSTYEKVARERMTRDAMTEKLEREIMPNWNDIKEAIKNEGFGR